jgi:Transglutaminase-like superfamily
MIGDAMQPSADLRQQARSSAPEDLQRWLRQTQMTDPGREIAMLAGLPADVGELCRIVQGLLIHLEWAAAYGVSADDLAHASRETLPLSARLRRLAEADGAQSLLVQRPPNARSPGTCRDFALMLCGLLRHQGIPARVRCGFAAYFKQGRWEDHWICESWLPTEGRWRRIDPQLDSVLVERLGIAFDATDIAHDTFMSADEAWLRCRSGRDDPSAFGHGTTCGMWFVRVNVMRDHCVLNGSEVSPWDSWRDATATHQSLSDDEQRAIDLIALHPAQALRTVSPPWIA